MTLGLFDPAFLGGLAAASGGWTPADITTALWLDAADASTITQISGAVSNWADKSTNGRDAAQGSAANRPVYAISAQNGLNAVRFSAASAQFMTAGTTSTWNFLHDGTSSAVFFVARCRNTGEDPNAVHTYLSTGGAATGATGFWIAYEDRASVLRNNSLALAVARGVGGTYAATDSADNKITPGAYHIVSSYLDADNATAANRLIQRVDGSTPFGSNTLTNLPSTNNSTNALTIGRDFASPILDFTGDICEVLIFNSQPITADRQKIEGYLAHKWGLAANLPAGHPYKSAAP